MTIVHPPFLLDFASAYLDDNAPEFPEEVMEEWRTRKLEEFCGRWAEVERILAALRRYGIHLTDIHLGNITFSGGTD